MYFQTFVVITTTIDLLVRRYC